MKWLGLAVVVLGAACTCGPERIDGPGDSGAQLVTRRDAGAVDSGLDSGELALDAGQQPELFDAGGSVPDAGLTLGLHLLVELHRDGGDVVIVIQVTDENDAGTDVGTLETAVFEASSVATDRLGHGRYIATATPGFTSGEMPVRVSLAGTGVSVTKVALVLPTIDPAWDQPEMVDRLVNTPGTEDSPTVSPDGEWLVVGTYSPIDVLGCAQHLGTGPGDGRNSVCQRSLGPLGGPARPRLPGANRVVSSTRIINTAPKLCLSNPDGGDFSFPQADGGVFVLPLAPVAGYGFHRQPDGSFAEPFVIAFDADGVASSFCFGFVGAPVGDLATFVYGNKRYDVLNDVTRPWVVQGTLGADVSLGTYSCANGSVHLSTSSYPLPVTPLTQSAGNSALANEWLVSDDETASPAFTIAARGLSDGGFAPWQTMQLPEVGDDRRQPVLENGRFYYYRNATVSSAQWLTGSATERSSFGAPRVELAGEVLPAQGPLALAAGRVVGLGQPTFAHRPDGVTEMYFVYYVRTATGYDAQIGRVVKR